MHHLLRNALICFLKLYWSQKTRVIFFPYLTSSMSISTTKRSGGWVSEPCHCITLSRSVNSASFNCFLPIPKNKNKSKNNSLVRQGNVNEIFLIATSKYHTWPALPWANAWHFGTWPPVSPRLKWRLRNDYRNSILMTDLGSAYDWLKKISLTIRPIRITTQIWVVTHFCSRFSDVI